MVVAMCLLEEAVEDVDLAQRETMAEAKLNGWTTGRRTIYLRLGAACQSMEKAKRLWQGMGTGWREGKWGMVGACKEGVVE